MRLRCNTLPTLSVIIPVYNGELFIGACLAALFASQFRDFEVIVVDDGSTDDTVSIVRASSCKLIRCPANHGPAAARNLGVAQSGGKLLFFLDADVLVQPDSLGLIVEAFSSRPDIDALFGSFVPASVPDNFYSRYKNLVHHYTHQNSREDAATFCGGFGAVRREPFLKIGGFDPQYRFLEDVQMGFRLTGNGYRVWLYKRLLFLHCKRYTLSGLLRSDLSQRAIPWTHLILETGVVRDDLNTRISNVLSVPVFFLLLAGIPALAFPAAIVVWLCLLVALVILNRGLLGLAHKHYGIGFAHRTLWMTWLIYLLSGVGVFLGVVGHFTDRSRRPATVAEPAP